MQLEERASSSSWRKKYWDRFVAAGPIARGQEPFRVMRAEQLALPADLAHCARSALTAPKGCVFLPLDVAMKTYALILHNRTSKELKEETDPFALLNGAVYDDGLFLYVPPQTNASLDLPITSGASRIHLFLGKGARLELNQTRESCPFALDHFDAVLDEEAELIRVVEHRLGPSDRLFSSLRARLKRSARFKNVSYSEGAACHRESIKVVLAEEESNVELFGLVRLEEAREEHTHILVEHAAPNARSKQHYKKVLKDKSRSSFEGKIYVHPEAQKTAAYQLNQNLLLSDEVMAHSKPNLEIFADDVKATHGATYSQLGEEDLFYLRSRGLTLDEARGLLLEGFCREVIQEIPYEQVLERLLSRLRS